MSAVSNPALDNVNELIKHQSRNSRRKACYPCHHRKVRCDGCRPCKRCIDRRHPDVCGYEPGPSGKRKRTAEDTVSEEVNRTAEKASQRITSTCATNNEECSTLNPDNTRAVQLTKRVTTTGVGNLDSALPQLQEQMQTPSVLDSILDRVIDASLGHAGMTRRELKGLLLPALGLQRNANATEPKLQAVQHSADLNRALELASKGSEIARLFEWYKTYVLPLNPHHLDISEFEPSLIAFLQDAESIKDGKINPPAHTWLASFFAVLAAGVQFSPCDFEKRTADSRLYAHESFAALHADHGHLTPDLPTIHTLLILVTVLQNNLDAEVAWSYVGLASRLAQSIDLDRVSTTGNYPALTSDITTWEAIVWQDCLLSLCLGRRSCTLWNTISTREDVDISAHWTYRQAMFKLATCSLGYINEQNALSTRTLSPIRTLEYASRLRRLSEQVSPEMRRNVNSKSFKGDTERLAFGLNLSYAIATVLRPVFESDPQWETVPQERDDAQRMCIDACKAAVEHFVDLHHISLIAERSWSCIHNALSCALILDLLNEGSRSEGLRSLQKKFLGVIRKCSSDVDRASPLWGPHARILAVFDWLESRRSAKGRVEDDNRYVVNRDSDARQGISHDQATSDPQAWAFESVVQDMDSPQVGWPFPDFLNDLPDFGLDDGELIGMYDTILWGDSNNTDQT